MNFIPMVLHLQQFVAETDLEKRAAHQVLNRDVAEMELFTLQAIRVVCLVADDLEVEDGMLFRAVNHVLPGLRD